MGRLGRLVAGLAAFSTLLSFFDYELTVLLWIESWGEGVAWLIRIGLFAVGAGFVIAAGRAERAPHAQSADQQPVNPYPSDA